MEGLMNYEEAATYIGIEVETAKKWVKSGRIPCIRFSHKCVRFKREDLDKFIESARVEAA